ncbi:spondin-1-like [Cherax quadricarinatus]|uniref:spondin-1-like n=1 Tax=Cherax quadricarinatus TaxID=27406 RepID=UPI00387E69AB
MHSEDCPNAVTQTSSISKSEIQVLWTAPPAGSGCVRFRAMVVENRDVWYMDDGELSKELCEEVQENDDMQPEVIYDCCACNEAKYEVSVVLCCACDEAKYEVSVVLCCACDEAKCEVSVVLCL